ncbi:MAG: hypothetical protein ACI943_000293, partial [Gammaproteobacteria bacterium]
MHRYEKGQFDIPNILVYAHIREPFFVSGVY